MRDLEANAAALASLVVILLKLPGQFADLATKVDTLTAMVAQLAKSVPTSGLADIPTACKRLGISEATARRMAKDGRLPVVRLGRSVRIDLSKIQPITDEQTAQAAGAARALKVVVP